MWRRGVQGRLLHLGDIWEPVSVSGADFQNAMAETVGSVWRPPPTGASDAEDPE